MNDRWRSLSTNSVLKILIIRLVLLNHQSHPPINVTPFDGTSVLTSHISKSGIKTKINLKCSIGGYHRMLPPPQPMTSSGNVIVDG